jgi:hypothetical protein
VEGFSVAEAYCGMEAGGVERGLELYDIACARFCYVTKYVRSKVLSVRRSFGHLPGTLVSSMVVVSPVPRHSVRGPGPGSTDEDVSAVDKVHELISGLCLVPELVSVENIYQSISPKPVTELGGRWVVVSCDLGKGGQASEGRD